FRAGAGPKQTLWQRTKIEGSLPAGIGQDFSVASVHTRRNGNSEFSAKFLGRALLDGNVPTADKHRGYGGHHRRHASRDPTFNAFEICVGSAAVLFRREEQRDVDR